jgi:hypothetical protein
MPLCCDEGMTNEMPDELREQPAPYAQEDLAPPDYIDPVIEAYKKDVDRTLLREMLKLTPQHRSEKLTSWSLFRITRDR